MSAPQGRCRRRTRKGVQAQRSKAAFDKASRVVGTDDTREWGYRPHALKQQQHVKLNEHLTRSVQMALVDGVQAPRTQLEVEKAFHGVSTGDDRQRVTDPTHLSSEKL